MSFDFNDIRARSWVMTLYISNSKGDRIKSIKNDFIKPLSKYQFLVFQIEEGEEEHHTHIQAWLYNKEPIRFSTLKANLPNWIHIEKANGSNVECYRYCTKEETRRFGPFEFGDIPPSALGDTGGTSSKKADMIMDILSMSTDRELIVKYPTIFRKQFVDEIRRAYGINLYTENRDLKITYISGPTRVGKSSLVRRLHSASDIYVVSDYDKDPFGSYAGQDVIIFEEYRGNFPISVMLQYLDIYPVELPSRYCNKQALYTQVYVISNWTLDQQYRFLDYSDKRAFDSRFTQVVNVGVDTIKDYKYKNGKVLDVLEFNNPLSSKHILNNGLDYTVLLN